MHFYVTLCHSVNTHIHLERHIENKDIYNIIGINIFGQRKDIKKNKNKK